MLQEFMQRVELETGRKKIRPCDYFDLVVAVDAAGYVDVGSKPRSSSNA